MFRKSCFFRDCSNNTELKSKLPRISIFRIVLRFFAALRMTPAVLFIGKYSMRILCNLATVSFFIGIVLSLLGVSVNADVFTDDFSGGIDYATWRISCNDPDYYTIDDTQGDVRINKIQGGTLSSPALTVNARFNLRGDFDLRVDFRDASINRISGNENQILLHAIPDEVFAIERSDTSGVGHNIHFFIMDGLVHNPVRTLPVHCESRVPAQR